MKSILSRLKPASPIELLKVSIQIERYHYSPTPWTEAFFHCDAKKLYYYYQQLHHTSLHHEFKQALLDQLNATNYASWYDRYEHTLLFWSWFKSDTQLQSHLRQCLIAKPPHLATFCPLETLQKHCTSAFQIYIESNYPNTPKILGRGQHKRVRTLFDISTGQLVAGSVYLKHQPTSLSQLSQIVTSLPQQLSCTEFETTLKQHKLSPRNKTLCRWLYWCQTLPLVPLLSVTQYQSTPVLIQALATQTLSQWIDTKTSPLLTRLNYCQQCIQIVNTLHQQGYVHRDIKPNNIFIFKHTLKLGDLDTLQPGNNPNLSRQSYAPGFKAPELWHPNLKVDPFKTDTYALGITLLCILTQTPRSFNDIQQWAMKHTGPNIPLIPKLPISQLTTTIQALLHRNPQKRLSVPQFLTKWNDIKKTITKQR